MKHLLFRILGSLLTIGVLLAIIWIGADTTPQPPPGATQPQSTPKSAGQQENSLKDFKIN